ncbi:glycosyltransferase family 4 protein [Nonlabens antarcticus]|uniref:glycosyltransferase family 4 protein n=1 Tax=Nonlabens antarcticus TaxID=392714 RepID=UPI001891656F|nr:glycosyltransferase family 4 protein [Nonlabens antarcticus]
MHIAFITPEYPIINATRSGGLGTSIRNLAEALAANDVEVTVFVAYQKLNKIVFENKVTIHLIKEKAFPLMNWYFYKKHLSRYVNKVTQEKNIDIIEVPDWTGITAFMNINVPLVVRFHGSDAYFCKLEGRNQKFKNRLFEKLNLKNAKYLISASSFTARETRKLFHLKKEITTIFNSVDTSVFIPIKVDESNDGIILYFGTVIRKKGVFDLIQMFNLLVERVPTATLRLIGKDTIDILGQQSTIELLKKQQSQRAAARTQFIEEVPYENIKEHIAVATVVTLPSYAEALPMTWIESMAMEKAMVTSNIGWANEIMVDGVTGYTIDPTDHQAYAARVTGLLKNPQLRLKMGRAARQQVEKKFSTDVVVKKTLIHYHELFYQ